MNAPVLIAHLPSMSPIGRDAGLCAPRLRDVFEGRAPTTD